MKITFAPCAHKWPLIKIKIVTFVEGLKLYHIPKSRDHAT